MNSDNIIDLLIQKKIINENYKTNIKNKHNQLLTIFHEIVKSMRLEPLWDSKAYSDDNKYFLNYSKINIYSEIYQDTILIHEHPALDPIYDR